MKTTGPYISRRSFIKNTSLAAAGLYMAPGISRKAFGDDEIITRYGCLFQNGKADYTEPKMDKAGFNFIRCPIYLTDKTEAANINTYLKDGYSVQINLNWNKTADTSTFPTPDEYPRAYELIKRFFEHHRPYLDQIPLIVSGNEWDNLGYHSNSIKYYLDALTITTEIAHSYGFKIADAGFTSTSLKRWMYSQLSGAEALLWKKNYWIAENRADYPLLLEKVQYYIDRIQNIPIDYLNVHWYNIDHAANGFPKAAGEYLRQCKQNEIITNEFGIKLDSLGLWKTTVEEVSSYETDNGLKTTRFALAYSAQVNKANKAIRLTDPMLAELANKSTNIIS